VTKGKFRAKGKFIFVPKHRHALTVAVKLHGFWISAVANSTERIPLTSLWMLSDDRQDTSLHAMEPKGSLPCAKKLTTAHHHELLECTWRLRTVFLYGAFWKLSFSLSCLPNRLFRLGFPCRHLYPFIIALVYTTFPANPILRDIVTSSLLDPDIFLGAIFSDTLNLNVFLCVKRTSQYRQEYSFICFNRKNLGIT
jgi:hypothetical protein